jgi:hypothetical protein
MMPPLLAALVIFEIVALTDIVPAPHVVADPHRFTVFTAGAFAAAFLVHMGGRPRRMEIGATLAAAAVIAALDTRLAALVLAGNALGKASLLVLSARAVLAKGEARREALHRLAAAAVLPVFLVGVLPALNLTAALHPTTYDGALYRLDAALGGQPSFAIGRWFLATPALATPCRLVYGLLPLGAAALLVIPDRDGGPPRASMIEAFVAAGALGFVVYHLCPAAGPIYAFSGHYPHDALPADAVSALPVPLSPAPRNCVPSLHTAWALLLFWYARPKGRAVRAAAGAWLVATELATLGLGEHYAVDLVIGVPFAVGVNALVHHGIPLSRPERWRPIAAGVALVAVWVLAVRDPEARLAASPIAAWLLVLVSVAVPLVLHLGLTRAPAGGEAVAREREDAHGGGGEAAAIFAAAVTAAVHALVAGRWLLLSVGSDARGAAVVAATYLAGLALGAWAAGKLAARLRSRLRALANASLVLSLCCGLAPLVAPLLRDAHASLAPRAPALLLSVAVSLAATLPASLAMGAALVLAATVRRARGAAAVGAAVGVLGAGCVLVPAIGPRMAAFAAVLPALLGALVATRLSRTEPPPEPSNHRHVLGAPEEEGRKGAGDARDRRFSFRILASLAPLRPSPCSRFKLPARAEAEPGTPLERALHLAGAAITLALATVHLHLFAALAGDSFSALAIATSVAALGVGLGGMIGARLPERAIPALALGPAIAALAGVLVWTALPGYFAAFDGYPMARGFTEREAVRFAVATVAIGPAAVAGGALHAAGIARIGGAAALGRHTALAIVAAAAGGMAVFVLVPSMGSIATVQVLAAASAALGLSFLAASRQRDARSFGPAFVVVVLLFAGQPARSLDAAQVAAGTHVHFAQQPVGEVIAHGERMGAVTVVTSTPDEAASLVAPKAMLHAAGRSRALLVGPGGAASTLRDGGFAEVDVVDRDGRAFLLTARDRWDLVVLPPIRGSAGAASLGTREAYALVRAHLAPGGVLAGTVGLRYTPREDLATAVATVQAVLPEVWIYAEGDAALIVACAEACPPRGGAAATLDPAATRKLVQQAARLVEGGIVTTDEDLRLEHSAPRGDVRSAAESRRMNLAFLGAPPPP